MPGDDLEAHARSTDDFYALLEVRDGATESEIKKAYRRTALKYHPDKNPGLEAVDKFHRLQIAYDVLSDSTARAIYNTGRQARWEKEQRERAYSDNRRKLKEDLERAERGEKRVRQEEVDGDQLMREARRIAALNKQRREEVAERLRKEEEEARAKKEEETAPAVKSEQEPGQEVEDMDRAVRVRWDRAVGADTGKDELAAAMRRFGEIDMVVMLKDKVKSKGKRTMGNATVIFKSMASADRAVEGASKVRADIPGLEEIVWSKGEPQAIKNLKARYTEDRSSQPSTPKAANQSATGTPGLNTPDTTSIRLRLAAQQLKKRTDGDVAGLKKMPSFGSFKDIPGTPARSSKLGTTPSGSPGVFQSPFADKHRQEERQRLVEQLQSQESAPS